MKLYLRQDWDYAPNYDPKEKSGVFSGRKKEKDQLINEFIRKSSGSILVSGVRGVGKTSVIYQALKEVYSEDNKILPIILNASQLELHLSNFKEDSIFIKELAEKILKNLIKRLYSRYFSLKGSKNSELEILYKKSIATTAKLQEESIYEKLNEETNDMIIKSSKKFTIDKEFLSRFITYVLSILGAYFILKSPFTIGFLNQLIGMFLLIIPNFTIQWAFEKIKRKLSEKRDTKSAKELYQFDASLSNLEYDLDQLLKSIKKDRKIVFVIDELDKIEAKKSVDNDQKYLVTEIIRIYKNLFNLSAALFVFITSESTYQKIIEAKIDKGWEYTLFSSKIFINKAEFEDIRRFILTIITKVINDDGTVFKEDLNKDDVLNKNKKISDFISFICYKSQTDFFELYNLLRDYITDFDKDTKNPIIEIPNLTADEKLEARLQEIVIKIYKLNSFFLKSDWHKNDAILNWLYEFLNSHFQKKFEVDYNKKINKPIEKNEEIIDKQTKSIKDIINWLLRLKIISLVNIRTQDLTGQQSDIREYQWTNSVPSKVPENFDQLFDQELIFVETINRFSNLVNQIDDSAILAQGDKIESYDKDIVHNIYGGSIQKESGLDVLAVFNKYEPVKNKLTKNIPEHITDDDLKTAINELDEQINKLKSNGRIILENLLKSACEKNKIEIQIQQLQNDQALFSLIQPLKSELVNKGIQHSVIYKKDSTKQLLTILNAPLDIFTDEIKKLLEQNRNSLMVINIQTNKEIDYSSIEKIKKKRGQGMRKKRLLGFENINISNNFENLSKRIQNILNWLKN